MSQEKSSLFNSACIAYFSTESFHLYGFAVGFKGFDKFYSTYKYKITSCTEIRSLLNVKIGQFYTTLQSKLCPVTRSKVGSVDFSITTESSVEMPLFSSGTGTGLLVLSQQVLTEQLIL